jgi:hypothetical protein
MHRDSDSNHILFIFAQSLKLPKGTRKDLSAQILQRSNFGMRNEKISIPICLRQAKSQIRDPQSAFQNPKLQIDGFSVRTEVKYYYETIPLW